MESLTTDNFKEIIKEGKAIVDFWAPWCGPCKMQGPIFEALSKELTEVNFFKVNVDEARPLAEQNNIRGIPTMVFYKEGEEVGRHSGILDKEGLQAKINEFLG